MADIIANISFLWSVLVMPVCTMSPSGPEETLRIGTSQFDDQIQKE